MMDMYRDIDTLPVFAEAGSIIPMTEEIDANSAAGNRFLYPEGLRGCGRKLYHV